MFSTGQSDSHKRGPRAVDNNLLVIFKFCTSFVMKVSARISDARIFQRVNPRMVDRSQRPSRQTTAHDFSGLPAFAYYRISLSMV